MTTINTTLVPTQYVDAPTTVDYTYVDYLTASASEVVISNNRTAVGTLSSLFISLSSNTSVYQQLTGSLVDIDVIEDLMFCETQNNFIITKINQINGAPRATQIINGIFAKENERKYSKPIIVNNNIYFFEVATELNNLSSTNIKAIIPSIYKVKNSKVQKVFPDISTDTSVYSLSTVSLSSAPDYFYNSATVFDHKEGTVSVITSMTNLSSQQLFAYFNTLDYQSENKFATKESYIVA